jgi:Tol biopolymer transport system component
LRTGFFLIIIAFLVSGCSQQPDISDQITASYEPVPGIAFVSARDGNSEIYLVQPDGSGLTRLTYHPEVDDHPAWSPDGKQIVFRSRMDGSSDIFIMAADGSGLVNIIQDREDSMDDEFAPAWHPEGDLLAIYTDRFRPIAECRTAGHHIAFLPVTGGIENMELFTDLPGEQLSFDWSPDGNTLALSNKCNETQTKIYLWDRESRKVTTLSQDIPYGVNPAWSPDGRFLAYANIVERITDIFVYDVSTDKAINLTNHPSVDSQPTWSPDGSQIAFKSDRDGNEDIFIINVDGSNPVNITQNPADDFNPAWSPIIE